MPVEQQQRLFIQSRLNAAAGRKETAHLLFLCRPIFSLSPFFHSACFFTQPIFSPGPSFIQPNFSLSLFSLSQFFTQSVFHSAHFLSVWFFSLSPFFHLTCFFDQLLFSLKLPFHSAHFLHSTCFFTQSISILILFFTQPSLITISLVPFFPQPFLFDLHKIHETWKCLLVISRSTAAL